MGTNYYAKHKRDKFSENQLCYLNTREDWDAFDLQDDEILIHLGKSSGGWRFSLHVYPELGIMNWWDVWDKLAYSSLSLTNEYADEVTLEEFEDVVRNRRWCREFPMRLITDHIKRSEFTSMGHQKYITVNNEMEYHKATGYYMDKNGLNIHPVDGSHCIGNGSEDETFDYIKGVFS